MRESEGRGQLKIKAFCLLSVDEFGRENGKWVSVHTEHYVTRNEALQFFQEFKAENNKSKLVANFIYCEQFS